MSREIEHIDIAVYSGAYSYEKYDVVYQTDGSDTLYFISASDGNVGNIDATGYFSNSYWKKIGDTGSWSFDEIWTPSYSTALDAEPRMKHFNFGDGYDQRSPEDLFGMKQDWQLRFQKMTDKESKSLLAFLEYHAGSLPFKYKPLDIFAERTYTFESFKHDWEAYNTHNINVIFMEV